MRIHTCHGIPTTSLDLGDSLFASAIRLAHDRCRRPVVVGLCGAQGSGKSTTARRLVQRLCSAGLRTTICSLDDFYLTSAERLDLAADVHPLLATRGVPGTHDVALIEMTIDSLVSADGGCVTPIPVFDKGSDDRMPEAMWRRVDGCPDVLLIEGWCVGARPQSEHALLEPINRLERSEDPDGRWRRYVNRRLETDYAALFARLDLRLMLRAPSFALVLDWRSDQEHALVREDPKAKSMTSGQLKRFVAHYERLTTWILQDQPAHLIAELDEHRRPTGWRIGDAHQTKDVAIMASPL